MDIAIKYEKINLGEEHFVFKPVSIIRGTYDEDAEVFETEYMDLCAPIDGSSPYEESYFGNLTTLEELREDYKLSCSDEELLTLFFEESKNCYCIGYFDYVQNKINVLNIPYEGLQQILEEYDQQIEGQEEENDVIIKLKLNKLIELMVQKSPEEIYSWLENVIEFAEGKRDELRQELQENPENKTMPAKDKKMSLQKDKSKQITLRELRKEVKAVIKGQDNAVDDVTRAIVINQLSSNPRHKSHMLVLGPSGTGKTEMINIIAKKLGIPYFKADATAYTKEGYVGKSVYSMFDGLVQAADGDIKKAQNGILIIDEIDKKLSTRKDDVGGRDVLYSLLKIMDREMIEVGDGNNKQPYFFDTSNLTLIFMGAFADLYQSKELDKKKPIGFGSVQEEPKKETVNVTSADLIKAGVPPEFLGRIPVITNTNELTLENLVEILYKSKGGAIDEEVEFCKNLGVTIKFTSGYMQEIAKKAKQTKTGARDLRKLVRESLSSAYDEILTGKKVKVLKLTKHTALDNKNYYTE